LFIEKVYSEAMLQGRANYVLVDDFDEETAKKFLEKYNIGKEEQEIAWNNFGGKPSLLRKFVMASDRNNCIKEEISLKRGQIETMLQQVKELEVKITIKDNERIVSYENITNTLKKFMDADTIALKDSDIISKVFLVNENVLFVDYKYKSIKPQSKVDLIAIREMSKDAGIFK